MTTTHPTPRGTAALLDSIERVFSAAAGDEDHIDPPRCYHVDLPMNPFSGEFWRLSLIAHRDDRSIASIEVWVRGDAERGERDCLVYDDLSFESLPAKARAHVLFALDAHESAQRAERGAVARMSEMLRGRL